MQKFWNKYWFEKDLLLSASVIRIFVGVFELFSLHTSLKNYGTYITELSIPLYKPIGILQLLPPQILCNSFFDTIIFVAYFSSICLILGLFTNVVNWLSVLSNLILASLFYSFGETPSHGFNAGFITHIALLFTPLNYYYSLDSKFFKYSKSKLFFLKNNGWGVYLAQLTVAMMFLNAAFYKLNPVGWIITGHVNLNWVLTDNLRNYIILEYLITQKKEIPYYLSWIIAEEYRFKLLALFNILSQVAGIFACFFVHKPKLRLFFGTFYLLELLGLGLIIGLWPIGLYLMMAVFVDWEYFLMKLNHAKEKIQNQLPDFFFLKRKWASFYIFLLAGFYFLVAFDPLQFLNRKLNPYPFASYPMYGSVFCGKPYNQHLPMFFTDNKFEISASQSTDSLYLKEYADFMSQIHFHWNFAEFESTEKLNSVLTTVLSRIKAWHVGEINWYRVINTCPAYPAKPELKTIYKGLIGKMDSSGVLKAVVLVPEKTLSGNYVLKLFTSGYPKYEIQGIKYILNKEKECVLKYQKSENKISFKTREKGVYQFEIEISDLETGKTEKYISGELDIK